MQVYVSKRVSHGISGEAFLLHSLDHVTAEMNLIGRFTCSHLESVLMEESFTVDERSYSILVSVSSCHFHALYGKPMIHGFWCSREGSSRPTPYQCFYHVQACVQLCSVDAGSVSTANGSALLRFGDTLVVCGVKAVSY